MSAIAVIWIGVAAVCCGLCVYGINRAIRRSKERQGAPTPAPVQALRRPERKLWGETLEDVRPR
jgi:hypothetical protein